MAVEEWTREEWAAIQEAVPVWSQQWERVTVSITDRPKVRYEGETPDDIMARHGITFDGDRAQYLRVERAIRRMGQYAEEAA